MLVKNKTTFWVLIALFSMGLWTTLYSCKKKNLNYEIQGTIHDLSFSNNLAGATVTLMAYPATNITEPVTLGTVVTGADGAYHFEFKREKYEKIKLFVSKAQYFDQSQERTLDNLDIEHTNQIDFSMYARSWVKIHITGDGVHDCKYIRQEGLHGCSECCPEEEHYFHVPIDTTITCINNGNTVYQVYYNVMLTPTQGPINVTTVPFDTTELLISY